MSGFVIEKHEDICESKLCGQGWFFVVSHFLGHKGVCGVCGVFFNHCCFPESQGSDKIHPCRASHGLYGTGQMMYNQDREKKILSGTKRTERRRQKHTHVRHCAEAPMWWCKTCPQVLGYFFLQQVLDLGTSGQ